MNSPAVSIIIPNYNGEPILRGNLACVVDAAHTHAGGCEVIVVDDASQDDSVSLISDLFPGINLFRHEVNQGFAEAVHTGIKNAANEIIILLNSDVRPESDFIEPLIEPLQNPHTFSVSPLICDPKGVPQTVSWNLGKIQRGTIKFRNWHIDEALDRRVHGGALKSLFASGGSAAMRKSMFLQLGGFLPIYKPFYYEDLDLCTRAWRRGWQTLFEPQSKVVHDHVGTIKRFFTPRRVRVIRLRNRFFYLWLYLSREKLLPSHLPWIGYRLLFRTVILDITFTLALIMALSRLNTVVALRSHLGGSRPYKSLEQILEEIES